MKKIVIIQGHPDPAGNRLCHALAEAYGEGARAAGHAVETIRVSELDFPLLRSQADYLTGVEGTPEALEPVQRLCRDADHIVLFYPLWLGTMPALLKGFLEQVFRPGVAFEYTKGIPKMLFRGKSARVVVTMGMPALAYRWYFGAHSLKSLERNILKFVGMKPVRDTVFGMVEDASDDRRRRWLDRMRRFGERAL
jgi:putative NADPH-quinone reductase